METIKGIQGTLSMTRQRCLLEKEPGRTGRLRTVVSPSTAKLLQNKSRKKDKMLKNIVLSTWMRKGKEHSHWLDDKAEDNYFTCIFSLDTYMYFKLVSSQKGFLEKLLCWCANESQLLNANESIVKRKWVNCYMQMNSKLVRNNDLGPSCA